MSRIKQVQQLFADGISKKDIKRRTGISLKTIRKYLRKLASGEPDRDVRMCDKELAAQVYDSEMAPDSDSKRPFCCSILRMLALTILSISFQPFIYF